ncbi:MAG: type 2 isopentenyl-diphosphate Delta-isomerase [Bacteroidia bacterium]|nr:MAG: type 2 isopentenyl-diphosphate Delta-isomerase [Bacteroidia bacterium]
MEQRKKDHIDLAFASQTLVNEMDTRFMYEPMLSAHPDSGTIPESDFLGKKIRLPMWVSSMTGGTKMAGIINRNLARACNEFGMGMGLGSCRIIMDDDTYFPDFDMRNIIGDHLPLYANLGINQLEILLENKQAEKLMSLVDKLQADGLIIHVNPFQEWFQPEGDRLKRPPIESVQELLEIVEFPVMAKEVGQGMGMESLRALMKLPLAAIEFGAFGGTNFAKVEMLRNSEHPKELFEPLSLIGHDAAQMVDMINQILDEDNRDIRCNQLIISGGIKSFLDGYYLVKKSKMPAIYGQASTFLKYAREDYDTLRRFVQQQILGLQMAYAYLRVR